MTLDEARKILREKGLSGCACKHKSVEDMLEKAKKIKEEELKITEQLEKKE